MRKLATVLFLVISLFFLPSSVWGDSAELQNKQAEIEALERKVTELQTQRKTLSSQIAYMDSQIKLTTLKISQTEEEIKVLTEKIGRLEVSLDKLAIVVSRRIEETYKKGQVINSVSLLFSSQKFSDFLTRYKYLQVMQAHDKKLLLAMETARINYDEQKKEVEALKSKLESQKKLLNQQKRDKEYLLEVTKNDEKQYQQLLAQARAELAAIQSILAGLGVESEVGTVGEGERVATVINGVSACSTGTHLHFEVARDGNHQDPSVFLSGKGVTWDNAPDGPFSFSGSWIWPIDDPVRITQGYGMTYFARVLNYYNGQPHTGIDMVNQDNLAVKSVRNGILYRGSIACGSGTLRYVKVKHQEGGIDTYYLHVNYYK